MATMLGRGLGVGHCRKCLQSTDKSHIIGQQGFPSSQCGEWKETVCGPWIQVLPVHGQHPLGPAFTPEPQDLPCFSPTPTQTQPHPPSPTRKALPLKGPQEGPFISPIFGLSLLIRKMGRHYHLPRKVVV